MIDNTKVDVGVTCFAIALVFGLLCGQCNGRQDVKGDWDREVCLQRFQRAESPAATLAVLKHYPDCFEHLPATRPPTP